MKICPQCSSVFGDDYVYCLNDGNVLRDESGEQETVFASRVRMSTPPEQESVVQCPACGLANRSNSRFCKKCGGPLGHVAGPRTEPVQPAHQYDRPLEHTVAFQPPVFTPPTSGVAPRPSSSGNRNALIGVALLGIFVIGGAIVYTKQSGDTATNNTSTNANRTNSNRVANAVNTVSNANYYPSQPNVVGREARLTTNVLIRSGAGNWNESMGSHYKNARVQVLEQTSFDTPEGTSTWYRVRVIQNGCDEEEGRGCGNDRNNMPGQAAMEGWMNARLMQLL